MRNAFDALLPQEAPPTPSYRWGYVTSSDPVEVILDNETTPIGAATISDVKVGERVLVLLNGRRATVLGHTPRPEPPAVGIWTSYPVTIGSTGTAPTLGNSTLVGRYCQIGKTVHVNVYFIAGSTFAPGTGLYRISLPVTAKASVDQLLTLAMVHSGGDRNGHARIEGSGGNFRLQVKTANETLSALGGTGSLVTPVSGSRMTIAGTYEAD